ncbi:MAG: hypothetical protein M9894_01230 [Planctomycetes bacterium]|nr:hypothetical protein [Planctomycetota bacterium]
MTPRLLFALVLALVPLGGCRSSLAEEATVIDDLVLRLRSEEFAVRQTATDQLRGREPVSVRHLVVPRLALESARVPLQLVSVSGRILTGRVVGGDERTLLMNLEQRVAEGALVSVPLESVKVLRLFAP